MLFSLNWSPVKPTILMGRVYHEIGGVFRDRHLRRRLSSCFYSADCVRTLPRQGTWLVLFFKKEKLQFLCWSCECVSGLAVSFWLLAGRLCLVSIFMTWRSINFSLRLKGLLTLFPLTSNLTTSIRLGADYPDTAQKIPDLLRLWFLLFLFTSDCNSHR